MALGKQAQHAHWGAMNKEREIDLRRVLETDTRSPSDPAASVDLVRLDRLTIVWHSDVRRVGETAWLSDLAAGQSVAICRSEPDFLACDGSGELRPLAEPTLSRVPLLLHPQADAMRLSGARKSQQVRLDGVEVSGTCDIPGNALERGVSLALGSRVVLHLRRQRPRAARPPILSLVGESPEMIDLRSQIEAAAKLDVSVLVQGESGTGKELVTRAIQARGHRQGSFQTLNMAAIPAALAASELFGAAKGAFSGADRARLGYFQKADGGTLFLDEIGETPREVQGLLLRVLESGDVQPVGAAEVRQVDVRVLAATDADLEQKVKEGSFSRALLQRLSGCHIELPPLRRRREDFGRLFLHFLRQELRRVDREHLLDYAGPFVSPFVSARLVANMVLHQWPGNVRELRNQVRQLVSASLLSDRLEAGEWGQASVTPATQESESVPSISLAESGDQAPPPVKASARSYRDPSDVSEREVMTVLAEQAWNIRASAESLGISRAALYTFIGNHPQIRQASSLSAAEIEQALHHCDFRMEAAARQLQVSKQGLKRRWKQLERERARENP